MKWQMFDKILAMAIIIGCGITLAWSADIQITTSVDRTVIGLNETFTLEVTLSGDKANKAGQPQIPDLSAFATYMGSSGTSQNIQIINGRMSVSISYSFTYMTTQLGKFTIPAVTVQFNGSSYSSNPIEIEIVSSRSGQPPGSAAPRTPAPSIDQPLTPGTDENLFLRAVVSKRRIYVNEPVMLSYKIYTRVTVTQYGINKLPETAGFWVEEYPLGNQPPTHEEIYNGKKYIVAEIKRQVLFPTAAGTKSVGPMQIECNVRVQTQRRSIFDSFFDDPFFGRSVTKAIASNPITIEVMPLPESGKPANFSGLAGQFNLSANVDKQTVKTNEAMSLVVKISGTGNIKMVPTPVLEVPPDFEKYEPKISENINRAESGISGNKTFEYVLIPRYPGLHRIKPVFFSFFDLASKSYKTLSTPEFIIDVQKGSDEFLTTTSGLSKEEVKLVGQDIRFIQLASPEFEKIGVYAYRQFGFLLLFILPVVMVAAAVAYRQHLDRLSENVAYARSRRANQIAMKRLRKAKKLLSEKTQKPFYAEIAKSLMGFLGDKFNISAAGIITDQVEELMKARNIDSQVIQQYLACLQVCDYQRFAPATARQEDMEKFFDQAREAIIALEKVV